MIVFFSNNLFDIVYNLLAMAKRNFHSSSIGYDVIQLCHGQLVPSFSSGYSLRCNELTFGMNRIRVSLFGPSVTNKNADDTIEFHANIMLLNALIRGNRSFEVLLARGKFLPGGYKRGVANLISRSKCVILEGPWHYRLVKDLIKDKPVIYDAHNFEAGLRRNNKYHDYVKQLEKEVCDSATVIITVTKDDMAYIEREYDVPSSKMRLLTHVPVVSECSWNGKDSKSIVFIGSLYEANIVAYREVEKIASALPNFNFVVLGSICSIPGKKRLNNLKCLGMIPESEKDRIMASSMLALNPILLGSGRNVKMVDYLAHSMPVISTNLGVRGFDPDNLKKACSVVEIEDFAKTIQELDQNREVLEGMSKSAHETYLKVKGENAASFIDIYKEIISSRDVS